MKHTYGAVFQTAPSAHFSPSLGFPRYRVAIPLVRSTDAAVIHHYEPHDAVLLRVLACEPGDLSLGGVRLF